MATTQPVTIAQALMMPGSGLLVVDSASAMAAALPNAGLVQRVASFTLNAPGVLNAAGADALAALGAKFHLAGQSLTVRDNVASFISPANRAGIALATTRQITDTAFALLNAPAGTFARVGSVTLTGSPTLSVTQLTRLESLPGFSVDPSAHITVADTLGAVAGVLAMHPSWLASASSVSVTLDGAQIGAASAAAIASLITGGKNVTFVPTPLDSTLNVNAAAQDVARAAPALIALSAHVPLHIAFTNEGSAISAAAGAALLSIPGFNPAGHQIYIADNAANLAQYANTIFSQQSLNIILVAGNFNATAQILANPVLHVQSSASVTLVGSNTATTATATRLEALHGFSVAQGATLNVQDSVENLLANASALSAATSVATGSESLASAAQANQFASLATGLGARFSLGAAALTLSDTASQLFTLTPPALALLRGVALNDDATISVAQAVALLAMPGFSANGHALTIADTAADLLAMPPQVQSLATATMLTQDATVTEAQFVTLRDLLHVAPGAHSLTVSDTPSGLLALSGDLSLDSATMLSATATVTAAQFRVLEADPNFSTAGHMINVADTASAILGLSTPLQLAASTLVLSADQTLSAAQLAGLAALGIKFSTGGHTVTVSDGASALSALSQSTAGLASGAILNVSATVNAATATSLAALPGFAVQPGAALTIMDSAANLLSLPPATLALAATMELPPGAVTLTPAQAAALASLPNFDPRLDFISISGTVADLLSPANAAASTIASAVSVTDSAANLAAAAASHMLQSADHVTLSGNATVSAATDAVLATIPAFSTGTASLTVSDSAAHIAAAEASIIATATLAIVTDSGPVSTAAADGLATLASTGKLVFAGGDQLVVADTLAALTDPANASGLAMASRITVVDNAANLITASSQNWNGVVPTYLLSGAQTVTAAQAIALAGLGVHFGVNGYSLSVADAAANVVGAAAALNALSMAATVNDSSADVASVASGLTALGPHLWSIDITGADSLTAATAASMAPLASKLTGAPIFIADNAANVAANLPALTQLAQHVEMQITDRAANLAAHASYLATLGPIFGVTFTDVTPVSAATAAALQPLQFHLSPASTISVADSAANLAANANAIAAIADGLGTVGLTSGNAVTVAQAAAIATLSDHLSNTVSLNVAGTADAIDASLDPLLRLQAAGHLNSVLDSNEGAASAVAASYALNLLHAQISISDTQDSIMAQVAELGQISGLSSLTVSDIAHPVFTLTLSQYEADAAVLALVTNTHGIAICDTAANLEADLASASPVLTNIGGATLSFSCSDNTALILPQSVALSAAVSAILPEFVGRLDITSVPLDHLGAVMALAPNSVTASDNAADLSMDLALGGSSSILNSLESITAIAVSDHGTITLTAAQTLTAGVDDGPSSALAKMASPSLSVTDASISDLAGLAVMQVGPSEISVSDTAAHIAAALTDPSSALFADANAVVSLHVSDGQPVVLTQAQDLAAGVNDNAGALLTRLSGAQLQVTGVSATELTQVESGALAPTNIGMTDTATNIVANLATILADRANLGGITVSLGTVTLSVSQALTAGVADGAGSLAELLPDYAVTGASVADLGNIAALPNQPVSVSVTDSCAAIVADLTSGYSSIAAHPPASITVIEGTLTLTAAQAGFIDSIPINRVGDLAALASGTEVRITQVMVDDLVSLAGWSNTLSGGQHLVLDISDTAKAIADDLISGQSALTQDAGMIGRIDLTGTGETLTSAEILALSALPDLHADGVSLPVVTDVAGALSLSPQAIALAGSVTVQDSAAQVSSHLDALQSTFAGALTITLPANDALTVSAATYAQDQATIDAITNSGAVTVSGDASSIAAIAATLAVDPVVGAINVNDTSNAIISNLSTILSLGGEVTVTLTDANSISAAAALIMINAGIANLNAGNLVVQDTATQMAALANGGAAALEFLSAQGAVLVGNGNISLATAQTLDGIRAALNTNGVVLNVWDTAAHLTQSGSASALATMMADGLISGIYLKTTGGTVSLQAANAVALLAIPGLSINNPDGTSNAISVADTAAHLLANAAALQADNAEVSALILNASATITGTALATLQSLNTIKAAGVSITVLDSAAGILNAAGVGGSSIAASQYVLSANGIVSASDALTLAGLPNFSAGQHTLTVALGADQAVSVSQADALGGLGAALIVTGHDFVVSGGTAALASLTSAGAAVAQVHLSDTLANIGALSGGSPLLTGTVTITDVELITAAQAQSFLSLLTAAGIADANVAFSGGLETVQDSIAALNALSSSAAWAQNAALHGQFGFVAVDSAANLSSQANASFLRGLSATELSTDATVSVAGAVALAALGNLSLNGHALTISDTAANLLSVTNMAEFNQASTVTLNGAAQLDAVDAEALLQIPNFQLTQTLTITDTSANLLDGTLAGLIAGHANIQVSLSANETLDAPTAAALTSLPGFHDYTHLAIADSSAYLLASGATAAETMAASVSLAGDESVSANTILRLSEVPHFTFSGGTLTLAGTDFANAATLKAIADMGGHFNEGGNALYLTQNDYALTPSELAAINTDGFVANGHVISALLVNPVVTDANNALTLTATGVSGASVNVYDSTGASLGSHVNLGASVSVVTADSTPGHAFSVTETVNGVESAPIVVLDSGTLESAVTAASANLAASGAIQVDTGKYINLYTQGAALPNEPALVYNPASHTIALDIPGHAPVTLITLGASTTPTSLDASEILFKHHG